MLVVALAASVAAFVVLFRRDRERAAWLAMPAFWPWTQWYYASMAIPGVLATRADRPAGGEAPLASVVLFAIAAAILAAPVTAAPAVALVVVAVGPWLTETVKRGRHPEAVPARST
jgi:hypothetical protein